MQQKIGLHSRANSPFITTLQHVVSFFNLKFTFLSLEVCTAAMIDKNLVFYYSVDK